MMELQEITFNTNDVRLQDNLVKGSVLPEKMSEMERNITVLRNTVFEGPVYAYKLQIENGDTVFQKAVFAQLELYVNSDATGRITFCESVGAVKSVVSRTPNGEITFQSDINAASVSLHNAFVSGSIFADNVILENCVVIGGIFATSTLQLKNCIVGTFNSPSVHLAQSVSFLLPSVFSIEKISAEPDTSLTNLTLADLGALFRGVPESEESGRIAIDIGKDEVKCSLAEADYQTTLRSYTVVGKVLAADMVDADKFQNHFLLTAASLGPQLLRTYHLGEKQDGTLAELTIDNIRRFFFDMLSGRIPVRNLSGSFSIARMASHIQ